jgi:hypothetical protein
VYDQPVVDSSLTDSAISQGEFSSLKDQSSGYVIPVASIDYYSRPWLGKFGLWAPQPHTFSARLRGKSMVAERNKNLTLMGNDRTNARRILRAVHTYTIIQ